MGCVLKFTTITKSAFCPIKALLGLIVPTISKASVKEAVPLPAKLPVATLTPPEKVVVFSTLTSLALTAFTPGKATSLAWL